MPGRKIVAAVALLLCATIAEACTTFFIHHNGKMVFGRNYDWMADAGMVCTNQRGLQKTSIKASDGKTISWISNHGSITFNQYGKEFPTGGMNEKGLVVELMWLDGTMYPKPDDRPAIDVLQWVQYQLDNCATIEEVIATDKRLRIVSNGTPLHYLVADAKGNAATIEFLNGKMVVHQSNDLPVPVLTNNTYQQSVASYSNGSADGNNSLERFSTACEMIQAYKAANSSRSLVDQSFDILNKVAQGDFTKWSIVYDITVKKIYFKTEQFQQVKAIPFSSFDFSCKTVPEMVDMNRSGKGDISNSFTAYSKEINQLIVEKSLKQSSSRIVIEDEEKRATIAYPDAILCK